MMPKRKRARRLKRKVLPATEWARICLKKTAAIMNRTTLHAQLLEKLPEAWLAFLAQGATVNLTQDRVTITWPEDQVMKVPPITLECSSAVTHEIKRRFDRAI